MGKPSDLTGSQWEATEHIEGPLLVLAGPGSGKTRVITRRIARLIQHGVSPREIVAITFTNKAAREMGERVSRLVHGTEVWVSTFHRFCARLLRRYGHHFGLQPNYTILDANDQRTFLKQVLQDADFDTKQFAPAAIGHEISRFKNRLVLPELLQEQTYFGQVPAEALAAKIYPQYQKRLVAANSVDFDDLLFLAVRLLYENDDLRQQMDARYRFVLVDEFQDTNHAQYQLVRALSHDFPNLCCTGDPDQSIYGWRGAELENILQFERDYPKTKVIRLEQNFRSTPEILRVADTLITHNQLRKHKELHTDNASGKAVSYVEFDSADAEADGLARFMIGEVEAGRRKWSDFAVLYRVNALSRLLERAFVRNRVPHQVASGVSFYERAEVKDLLAYLRVVHNPKDVIAFRRIINVPQRGLGKQSEQKLLAFAEREGLELLEACQAANRIPRLGKKAQLSFQNFARMFAGFNLADTGSVEGLLQKIVQDTRYTFGWDDSRDEELVQKKANVDELIASARTFDEQAQGESSLDRFLEEASLVADLDNIDSDAGRVSLMTLHSAKGLEFPVVFIVGVEDNLIPHRRAKETGQRKDEEEERRLLFVGITRAESELFLTRACRRDIQGRLETTIPSTFIRECGLKPVAWDFSLDEFISAPIPEVVEDPVAQHKARMLAQLAAMASQAKPMLTTGASLLSGKAEAAAIPIGFTIGMRVRHPSQGYGEVVEVGFGSRRTVTVRYESGQEATYIANKCPLQPAGRG